MSQLTITLDDKLLQAAQEYARRQGQELDALVAHLLQIAVQPFGGPTGAGRGLCRRASSACLARFRYPPILIIKKHWTKPSKSATGHEAFFVDTNVLLDFLMRRAPFAFAAAELFQLAEDRKIWLYCSSLSFSQAHYVLRKVVGSSKALGLLVEIADIATIVAIDSRNVKDALRSSFGDFEDALQYFAALAEVGPAIEAIVTRDPKGFATSELPVLTPLEALAQVE